MPTPLAHLLSLAGSQKSIGWGSSAVLHVVGMLAASSVYLTTANTAPQLPGAAASRVELQCRLSQTEAIKQPEQPQQSVLILPQRAHVARQTFQPASADVSEPTPEERAFVDRVLATATPPPRRSEPPIEADRPSDAARRQPTRHATEVSRPASKVRLAQVPREAVPAGNDTTLPRLRNNRPPVYPPSAIAARLQGTVIVRLRIDAEGNVANLQIERSSGHALLDAAAVQAVRHWRFVPAQRRGRPVATTVRLPVRFSLD